MNRRQFTSLLSAAALQGQDVERPPSAMVENRVPSPFPIGAKAQLFVERTLVSDTEQVCFTLHSAEKHPKNPLVIPDKDYMKVAIYVRVSAADQNQELQLRELQDYAARHQWEIAQVYQDTISGASASRPGLNQLMDDARARRLDIVLCWKLDRFGRSLLDCLANLRELDTHGVRFIATTQALDTDIEIRHQSFCSTCSEPQPSLNGS